MGDSSRNHQRLSRPTSSAEPRSRKRVCGLSFGMRDGAGAQDTGYPEPEDHHSVQHDQALPQIGVGKIEPGHAVLAQIEEGDEAKNVDCLNDRDPGQKSGGLHPPGSRKGEDRGAEQNGDVDRVTAVAHLHREAAGSAQNRAVPGGVAATHPDQAVRDPHQRAGKLAGDGLRLGRDQQTESDQQAAGEDKNEVEGADKDQITVIAESSIPRQFGDGGLWWAGAFACQNSASIKSLQAEAPAQPTPLERNLRQYATMKLPALFTLAAATLAAAGFPEAEISNGSVRAKLYLPDAREGYYRATRFDWSGQIASLEFQGHRYFGQWFDRYAPNRHDCILGPVEEFLSGDRGLGYNDVKPGESFVKIGVGAVRKPEERAFQQFKTYEITDPGTWTVNQFPDRVEYTQELRDTAGYAYVYKKIVRLTKGKPQLVLEHSLKNTGSKV